MTNELHKENVLIHEKSPFLKQHADDSINWYPWGNEAFLKARQENKPIFLFIGCSTSHMCHVMKHESFEDQEVADYLNEHFVAVLVDREKRPDIDSIYGKASQLLTGQSGFPLSIFMTPDKIPYYAGNYFPRNSKHYMPGIIDVLASLYKEFKENQEGIEEITNSLTSTLENTAPKKGSDKLTGKYAIQAYQLLDQRYDKAFGGFGAAPKYPAPQHLLFLLRFYHFTGKKDALKTVEQTVKKMTDGGIYDHIGFGFFHYSTDMKWQIPSFEKMLYDNALLLTVSTECYQITKKPLYERIAKQIITFVMHELHRTDGAFNSAIDADTEDVEGNYYTYEYTEIFSVLGHDLGNLFAKAYDITPNGNFKGENVPNLVQTNLKAVAEEYNLTIDELHQQLEQARIQLLSTREKRTHPHIDDNVLTSWNALMITALAKAGNVFEEPEYINTAEKTLHFIENNLIQNERIMAGYYDGSVNNNGYLNDYAYLLWSYIELYNSTHSLPYLENAKELADRMIDLFWDNKQGGFFISGHDSEELFVREKEIFDGTLPAGNGIAARMLAQLGYLTGETAYLDLVKEMYHTFYNDVRGNLATTTSFMQSLMLTEIPTKEVIVLGDDPDFTRKVQQEFLPDISLISCESEEQLAELAPKLAEYKKLNGETMYYVCENFVCKKPTTEPDEAWKLIKK